MKRVKSKSEKEAFDGITFGQAADHISKKNTTKTHRSKKSYNRKIKHKLKELNDTLDFGSLVFSAE
jgi:hypothetical protein